MTLHASASTVLMMVTSRIHAVVPTLTLRAVPSYPNPLQELPGVAVAWAMHSESQKTLLEAWRPPLPLPVAVPLP